MLPPVQTGDRNRARGVKAVCARLADRACAMASSDSEPALAVTAASAAQRNGCHVFDSTVRSPTIARGPGVQPDIEC
jgi:hypothetical protein